MATGRQANHIRGNNNRQRRGVLHHLADNSPYIATVVLGAWVLLPLHWAAALAEVVAGVLGPLWIIIKVCPNCHLYGSSACQSGYGLLSSRLAAKGDTEQFGTNFNVHIIATGPMWFLPVAGAVWLLLTGGEVLWLVLIAFLLVTFMAMPLKARYYTCARCANRDNCPWGSRTAKRRNRVPKDP